MDNKIEPEIRKVSSVFRRVHLHIYRASSPRTRVFSADIFSGIASETHRSFYSEF